MKFFVFLEPVGGRIEGLQRCSWRIPLDPKNFLHSKRGGHEDFVGLPELARRFLALELFVDFGNCREIGNRRVSDDIAAIIELAESHQWNGFAFFNQRHDSGVVGRRRLVIDIGFTPFKRDARVSSAFETKHTSGIQLQELETDQRNHIEPDCADPPID